MSDEFAGLILLEAKLKRPGYKVWRWITFNFEEVIGWIVHKDRRCESPFLSWKEYNVWLKELLQELKDKRL